MSSDATVSTIMKSINDSFIGNSPTIIACIFASLSVIYQNWNGLIYIGFLLGALILRVMVYYTTRNKDNTSKCYDPLGLNTGFSTYVFAFTFGYAFVPMFIYDDINFWLFAFVLGYFGVDTAIKLVASSNTLDNCFGLWSFAANLVAGVIIGSAICASMIAGGSGKFLFFNEISTSKSMCSMKNNQQFKCSVYKNGELISNA